MDHIPTLIDAVHSTEKFIRAYFESVNPPNDIQADTQDAEDDLATAHFRIIGGLVITGPYVEALNAVENRVYEAVRKHGHFSRKATESLVHQALQKAILEEGKAASKQSFELLLKKALAELKESLQKPPSEWECYIRIIGFGDASLSFDCGRVHFMTANDKEINQLTSRIEASVQRTKGDAARKDSISRAVRSLVAGSYSGQVLSMIKVSAVDSNAATDAALREVRKTLDVLNFFSSWEHPPHTALILPWEGKGLTERFLAFCSEKDAESVAVLGQHRGVTRHLNVHRIERITGFREASSLLGKTARSEFDNRLLSALQWAGRAAVQERQDQAFLFYVISLENLLLGTKKEGEIGYRFRIRGAHLLGDNVSSRKDLQQLLKTIYNLRSKIVHTGSAAVRDTDLALAQQVAKNAVIIVLTQSEFSQMKQEKDLEEYFDEKVLQ